jgi:hypothetical protein
LQGRYLHRTTQTQSKGRHTSRPGVGLESTIAVFDQAKTVHALDCAAILAHTLLILVTTENIGPRARFKPSIFRFRIGVI